MIVKEKWGETTTSTWILANHVPTCRDQVSSPNQWLCSPGEQSWWCSLNRELSGGAALLDLGPEIRSFVSPGARSSHTQAGELSHSCTHCGVWFTSPSDRKGWWEYLETVTQQRSSWKEDGQNSIHPRAKPVALLCDNLGRWDGVGRRFKRERTYVCLWLIHVDVWQKPIECCK